MKLVWLAVESYWHSVMYPLNLQPFLWAFEREVRGSSGHGSKHAWRAIADA